MGSEPIELDGKLCMYYTGRRTDHTISVTSTHISALGRAWLRIDGFVSFTGGRLVTKNMDVNGTKLIINAKGKVTARLFDENGTEINSGAFSGNCINGNNDGNSPAKRPNRVY